MCNRRNPGSRVIRHADRQLVLSFFGELAADAAAMTLMESGLTYGDPMGILVLSSPTEISVDKVGARSTAAGAGIGASLLLLFPGASLGIEADSPLTVHRVGGRPLTGRAVAART